MNTVKNDTIKKTLKETRARRENMLCRVYSVKIVLNKLSKEKKALLDQYFREAKWLRNSELAKGYDKMDRNAKIATVKIGAEYESRPLALLGSQVKQDIVDNLRSEIRGLSTKKSRGEKVGHLKYKSYCNSIPLRQYGTTYNINFENNTVSIQNMKKFPLKVRGLNQIPTDAEIANAKLVRKPSGFYLHITTYTIPVKHEPTGAVCGIDFGIGHNLTLSDGAVLDIHFPETKGVKLASKRVNKSKHRNKNKKSNNHYRRVKKLQKAYERQSNQKINEANTLVSHLLNTYDFIAIQDEMIANWHKGLFGKQVQHSAMGFIKAKLKTNSKTFVVDKSFPSTQICPVCGLNTKHNLNEREYYCQHCGYHHPSRDIKAANSILTEALRIVSAERRTQSPVEIKPSIYDANSITDKALSVKQEAQLL